jgi:hypothetical protein
VAPEFRQRLTTSKGESELPRQTLFVGMRMVFELEETSTKEIDRSIAFTEILFLVGSP